jgi:hypothetical protein
MSALTTINSNGTAPMVTVRGGNLIRYTCTFRLWKPEGQVWPETGERNKVIHEVTFNADHPPTDTFSLGSPGSLRGLDLTWDIDMIVPGGGGPLHFTVSVVINQDGVQIMAPPFADEGDITDVGATSGDTELRVQP